MVHDKTNPEISLDLSMVSVPEQPAQTDPMAASTQQVRSVRRFGLIRILQKLSVLVLIALLSLGCYVGISHYFLESVEVVGVSMTPTLHDTGVYILNRWAFHNRKPQPGDVVVLRDPEDKGISVKRIIAVEGDSVHFRAGKVFVNGKELNEPYLAPGTYTFTQSMVHEQFITCGKDRYFVLGDNRMASVDSRAYGPVAGSDIMGLVVIQ